MEFKFSKEIYPKTAVLKAAYSFTDRAYIHIAVDEADYLVTVEPKSEEQQIELREFQNEILAQSVRLDIQQRTKNVRELMLARAFSSTVIVKEPENREEYSDNAEEILVDWFEKYEKQTDN